MILTFLLGIATLINAIDYGIRFWGDLLKNQNKFIRYTAIVLFGVILAPPMAFLGMLYTICAHIIGAIKYRIDKKNRITAKPPTHQ